jgi:DNA-binding transcriptional regulator YiaG
MLGVSVALGMVYSMVEARPGGLRELPAQPLRLLRNGIPYAIHWNMDASQNGIPDAITSGQVRAARSLLGLTREQLSHASGVPMRTLSRLEDGVGAPRRSTLAAIRAALEAAGVEFIPENGGGAGVRLKARA